MQSKLTWKMLFIVAIIAFALLRVWPPEQKLQGGLDLVGGYSLTYKVDLAGDKEYRLYISGLRELLGFPASQEFSNKDWATMVARHKHLKGALTEADAVKRRAALQEKAGEMAEAEAVGDQVAQVKAEKFRALEKISRLYRDWRRLKDRQKEFGDPREVLNQLINILRERVDPDGTRNTVWKPLPPDRIVIDMSRAPDAVKDRFDEYGQALDAVVSQNVDLAKLAGLLEKDPAVRSLELPAFLKKHQNAEDAIKDVFRLYDRWQDIKTKVDALTAARENLGEIIGYRNVIKPADAADISIAAVDEFVKLADGTRKDARRKTFLAAFSAARLAAATKAVDKYELLLADPLARSDRRGPAKAAYNAAMNKLNLTKAAVLQVLQSDAKSKSKVKVWENGEERRLSYREVAISDLKAKFPGLDALDARKAIPEDKLLDTVDARTRKAWAEMGLIDYLVFTWQRYEKVKGPLSDPSDLRRLLKGAGELRFAIVVARGDDVPDENTLREVLKRRGLEAANDYNPEYRWFRVRKPDTAAVEPFKFTDHTGRLVRFIRENIGGTPKKYRKSQQIMMDGERVLDYVGGVDYILCYNTLEKTLDDRKPRAWKLIRAGKTSDERGLAAISFQFDPVGANYFGELTGSHKGQQMAVILDGEVYSAPSIKSRISDKGIITGQFTPDEQSRLVRTLISGMLPGRLVEKPVSERLISASIGTDNVQRSLTAGLIALAIVTIFMICYYMITGVIADIALLTNILFVLAAMVSFGATFTLAGVAGVILTIGMAVDANILINERIREELANSRTSLRLAIRNAYDRVRRTIIDANLTTLLTALVLLWVGNDEVKGFGITLTLGLLLNMFTSLFITRVILQAVTAEKGELRRMFNLNLTEIGPPLFLIALVGGIIWLFDVHGMWGMLAFFALIVCQLIAGAILIFALRGLRRGFAVRFKSPLPMLQAVRKANVDWVKKKTVFWIISSVLMLFSLFALVMRGVLSDEIYGIEFRPGVLIQMNLQKPMSVTEARDRVRQVAPELIQARRPDLGRSFAVASVVGVGDPTEAGGSKYLSYLVQLSTAKRADTGAAAEDKELIRPEAGEASRQVDEVAKELTKAFMLSREKDGENYAALAADLKDGTWLDKRKASKVGSADLKFEPVNFGVKLPDNWRIRDAMSTEGMGPKYRLYDGGVRLYFDRLTPALTTKEIGDRIRLFTRKEDVLADFPDLFHNLEYVVFPHGQADKEAPVSRFEVVAKWMGGQLRGARRITFLKGINQVVTMSLAREEAFPLQQSVDPYIAQDSKTKAIWAIVLSLAAIIAYVWIRFGRITYGLAAVLALAHDVIIAAGMVCLAGWIVQWTGTQPFWLKDFKIDLPMVAAFLMIVGYSLNDTIVVFDRVRENRGRLGEHSPEVINASINQNLGRTIMTSLTTLMVVVVMYIWGGEAIRGFNFAIIIGVIVGTYSSIAIASPLLLGLRSLGEKLSKHQRGRAGKQAPSIKTLNRRAAKQEIGPIGAGGEKSDL